MTGDLTYFEEWKKTSWNLKLTKSREGNVGRLAQLMSNVSYYIPFSPFKSENGLFGSRICKAQFHKFLNCCYHDCIPLSNSDLGSSYGVSFEEQIHRSMKSLIRDKKITATLGLAQDYAVPNSYADVTSQVNQFEHVLTNELKNCLQSLSWVYFVLSQLAYR